MVLGDKKVQARAQKLANQQMRVEILPLLSIQHARPNSWNPLRSDVSGEAPYGMKLWLPDKLAMEILKSDELMAITERIVMRAVEKAAILEPKAFIENIFEHLIGDVG